MLDGCAITSQRSRMMACKHWLPSCWRRPLSPESLSLPSGSLGCRSLSFPTRLCHTWHWFRRLHSAIPITNNTRAKAVLARTRRALVDQGSLCCTHLWITSLGYTSLSIVMLTCSHTLSSTSISRHLYMESSLVFLLSGILPDLELSCLVFPLLALSEMYWAQGPLPHPHSPLSLHTG